ncbi:MAG: efflux RND transporter periplasmic adaptor subunit [Gammaproteobacteria bacterium]|nr:efflux RND transporter periplasmic adaptor subunit [Gammaproteobacteria bacterium]
MPYLYRVTVLTGIMALGSLPLCAALPPAEPTLPVETITVQHMPLTNRINAVGSLLANEIVTIRPEISGRVAEIHFNEGEPVKKGAVMVTLDQGEAQARVAESKAQMEVTKVSYDRATELIKNKLISQQQLDDVTAQYSAAVARLNVNHELWKKTQLIAPFDGIAGLRQVSPGDYVQPGQAIVSVVDQHLLKVEFQVPEIYLAQLRNGMEVQLSSDAYPGKHFSGKVYAIAPTISATSRSIAIRAKVNNDKGVLRSGLFAQVTLQLGHNTRSLVVPEEALWPVGDQQFVYKVVQGKAQLAPVKLGLRLEGKVEVTEGLQEGDQVVIDGQMKLRPGAAVTPMNRASTVTSKPAGAH